MKIKKNTSKYMQVKPMKYFLLLFLLLMSSCLDQDKQVNEDFEQDFEFALEAINEYDKYRGIVYDYIMAKFNFSSSYLWNLTKIDASVVYSDFPQYSSRKDCLNDLKRWKIWYSKNKYNVTKEYSDSIKQLIWNLELRGNLNNFHEVDSSLFFNEKLGVPQISNEKMIVHVESDFLYYPFGRFNNMDEFLVSFPADISVSKKEIKKLLRTSYILKYKNSKVDVILTEVFRGLFTNIEIAEAHIVDPGIKTINNIEIGISKELFFDRILIPYSSDFDKIKTIEVFSKYKEIKCRYTFDENNLLNKIEFYTGYDPEKMWNWHPSVL